jgi:acyl dehydratase
MSQGYEPRGLYYEDFEIGDAHFTAARTVTEADVVTFAGLSGDFNPLHTDEEFGKTTPFGGRVAHGVLTLAIATGLTNQLAIYEGTTLALMELTVRFTGAVKFGDTVHVVLTPTEKREHKKADRGFVVFGLEVKNQRDETVLAGSWTCLQRRRPSEGA